MQTDKNFLKLFKSILYSAATFFNRSPNTVSLEQFRFVSKGKASPRMFIVIRIVGYASLRNLVAPSNGEKSDQKAIKALIAKLVTHA